MVLPAMCGSISLIFLIPEARLTYTWEMQARIFDNHCADIWQTAWLSRTPIEHFYVTMVCIYIYLLMTWRRIYEKIQSHIIQGSGIPQPKVSAGLFESWAM